MDPGPYLNISAVIVLAAVLYFLVRRKRKLPPGPWGMPVLGYYPFLGKEPEKTVAELGKRYGNIFGLHIGPQYAVVLNNWDTLVEAYKQDGTIDRPETLFGSLPFHIGIDGSNGEEWHYVRRLMMKTIKDIGLRNTRWEELMQEEVGDIVQLLTSRGSEPIEMKQVLDKYFAKSIISLVLGRRLPEDHPLLAEVIKGVDAVLSEAPTMSLMNFSPRLMWLMQILGVEKRVDVLKILEGFTKFAVSVTDEKLRSTGIDGDESFIDLFRGGLQSLPNKAFDEKYIEYTVKGNVLALLTGGSETSRSSLLYLLAAVAEHPDKQKNVQEELDRVIGQDGSLFWSDRAKVPYTHATILESMRWKTLVPVSTMRIATADIQVQGYDIPRGTFIIFNAHHIHNDPSYWTDPEGFVPERFLTTDGKKVLTDVRSYVPFGHGKRNCLGQLLANLEIFQYFVTLMQRFTVTPSSGDKVDFRHTKGLTFAPYDVKLCFTPRR